MNACKHGKEYLGEELRRLQVAIAAERRRLNRTIGHDVGFEEAKRAFLNRRLGRFAKRFHSEYCGNLCRDRAACSVKTGVR